MSVLVAAFVAASLAAIAPPSVGADPTAAIVVQVAEDDGAAAHELAGLVERHGGTASPPMRLDAPAAGLSRLGAAREACKAGALGVFWLDAQRPDEWRLYALPCATDKPLVREIVVSTGAEQAAIEASWLIARSSAVAIAEGHELAMVEANPDAIDDAPQPEPPPVVTPPVAPKITPPPAPVRRDVGLRASLAYGGESLARSIPWRHGVFAALAWAPRRRLRIGGWYEFLAPGRLDEPAAFAAWRHAVALTIAAVLPFARRLAFELRTGPELELARWQSRALGRGTVRAIPRLGGDATLQIGLGPQLPATGGLRRVALDLGVGVAVALIDVDFVTCAAGSPCTGAGRRVVADAWRARPRARAGLSVQF